MNKHPFLLLSLSVSVLSAQTKTNVLVFVADDMGWKDLGCYGSTFYETPNLDQLAKDGMLFQNAYAAAPVSSPSRASLITGKYPATLGMTDWIKGHQYEPKYSKQLQASCPVFPPENIFNLPLQEVTLAEMFKKNGYRTAHIGKWHVSEDSTFFPQYQGYDVNIGGNAKGSPAAEGGGSYFVPYNNPNLPDGPAGEYLTDRLGNECLKLLNQFKNDPFYISFPFYQVHAPLVGKPEKVAYFKEKAKRLGLDTVKAFTDKPTWKTLEPVAMKTHRERIVQSNAVYAAMIASMDENIGKVIAELKRLGLYENTIILFTSDNGGVTSGEGSATSNLPLKAGKSHMYEGGIREPLIAVWKGHIPANKKSETLVSGVDFFPTLLELTGINYNAKKIDGKSVAPAMLGNKQDRGAIYWHYPHYHPLGGRPASAIREGDYKLIQFLDNQDVELYNLKKDIGETTNLALKEKETTKRLLNKLNSWKRSVKAKDPKKKQTL